MSNLCIIHNRRPDSDCLAEGGDAHTHETTVRQFLPGQVIFEEGEAITGVYCIQSGRVALMKRHPLHGDLLAYVAEAGDVPGMPGIVLGDHYINGAVAMSEVSACFITREDFLKMIREQPEIAIRAMQQISRRIERAEREIEEGE